MACSSGNDRPITQSITSPSAVAAAANSAYLSVGAINSPMVVGFPGRDFSNRMRNDLEAKYVSIGRSTTNQSFVDREGEVVWMQEYIRYRVNGCDQGSAVARVITQIAGGPALPVCADVNPNQVVLFPPRNEMFDARRALETQYQAMGRGITLSAVDLEGSSIWISEYLRYSASGCAHDVAVQNVFTQIDGNPPPATCFVPCAYSLNPGGFSSGDAASTQSFQIRPTAAGNGTCAWTLGSTASWLTVASGFTSGVGLTDVPYSIAQNNGPARTAHIDVAWQGGGARYTVDQAGTPFNGFFTMTDPAQSGTSPVTSCNFRSTSTTCTFTATANLPGPGAYTYQWSAGYFYGTQKATGAFNNSNTFSITDSCGGADSSADGPSSGLTVSVTITDSLGNTITLRSGENNQPGLSVRLFSCGA